MPQQQGVKITVLAENGSTEAMYVTGGPHLQDVWRSIEAHGLQFGNRFWPPRAIVRIEWANPQPNPTERTTGL